MPPQTEEHKMKLSRAMKAYHSQYCRDPGNSYRGRSKQRKERRRINDEIREEKLKDGALIKEGGKTFKLVEQGQRPTRTASAAEAPRERKEEKPRRAASGPGRISGGRMVRKIDLDTVSLEQDSDLEDDSPLMKALQRQASYEVSDSLLDDLEAVSGADTEDEEEYEEDEDSDEDEDEQFQNLMKQQYGDDYDSVTSLLEAFQEDELPGPWSDFDSWENNSEAIAQIMAKWNDAPNWWRKRLGALEDGELLEGIFQTLATVMNNTTEAYGDERTLSEAKKLKEEGLAILL